MPLSIKKNIRRLPHSDRKLMGGWMICRAWLYQTEIDGQGQTGLWGKVALVQQAALEGWGRRSMAVFNAVLSHFWKEFTPRALILDLMVAEVCIFPHWHFELAKSQYPSLFLTLLVSSSHVLYLYLSISQSLVFYFFLFLSLLSPSLSVSLPPPPCMCDVHI